LDLRHFIYKYTSYTSQQVKHDYLEQFDIVLVN